MMVISFGSWRLSNPLFRKRIPISLIYGGILCSIFILLAILSLVWVPYDVTQLIIERRFQVPSVDHWLGTDQFGRDILSMIMVGARISISVSILAVGIGFLIGVPFGLLAAARCGLLTDEIIMRCGDVSFAFPALLTAILLTTVFGPGAINSIIAIGIFNIPVFMRLSRAMAFRLWESSFIMAARVAGKGAIRISLEHILPNVMPLLIVQVSIQLSLGILSEAALSYMGFGTQPPLPSWGRMLSETQTFISIFPHTAIVPGVVIVLMILGLHLVGDGLRELFDSKSSQRFS